jgi:hypothetical protein
VWRIPYSRNLGFLDRSTDNQIWKLKFTSVLIKALGMSIGLPLCLVVRVPGYRYRGLGSIPEGTRFSEK